MASAGIIVKTAMIIVPVDIIFLQKNYLYSFIKIVGKDMIRRFHGNNEHNFKS